MTQGLAIVAALYTPAGVLVACLYRGLVPAAFKHRHGVLFAGVVVVVWPVVVALAVVAAGAGIGVGVAEAARKMRADQGRQGGRR